MSVNVTLNGTTFTLPETSELDWGTNVTDYLTALSSGVLQKAGGTFTLTADVNFGATYGLITKYYKSISSNISTAGVLRLSNTDTIGFRNSGNSANLLLGVGSSDGLLSYNSVDLVTVSATQTLTNKTFTSPTLTGFTISRALVTDGSGNIVVSSVTSTELGYVSGVTSAIQTQLNNKQPLDTDLTNIAALTGTSGFLTTNGAGTWAVDTNTYLTGIGSLSIDALSDVTITSATTGQGLKWNGSAWVNTSDISNITIAETRSANINMADNVVQRPEIKDYAVTHNTVSSSAGAVTFDMSTGNSFQITLSENVTSITISNPPASGKFGELRIRVIQGASAYTVTGWPSVKWPGGTAPTITTTASAIDQIILNTDNGGTTYLGNYSQAYS